MLAFRSSLLDCNPAESVALWTPFSVGTPPPPLCVCVCVCVYSSSLFGRLYIFSVFKTLLRRSGFAEDFSVHLSVGHRRYPPGVTAGGTRWSYFLLFVFILCSAFLVGRSVPTAASVNIGFDVFFVSAALLFRRIDRLHHSFSCSTCWWSNTDQRTPCQSWTTSTSRSPAARMSWPR